jgi:hypothetical protein
MRARRRIGRKLGHSNPQHPGISNVCANILGRGGTLGLSSRFARRLPQRFTSAWTPASIA